MTTGRGYLSGFGIQTGAIAAGGNVNGNYNINNVESYNGTSWTATTTLSTARGGIASGIGSPQTSGVVFGGFNGTSQQGATEAWTGVGIKTITVS